ncbi:MAG: hypothetical protein ACK5BE_03655 [Alphaproteobacteria bacterium]|jgi:hypothetical protein
MINAISLIKAAIKQSILNNPAINIKGVFNGVPKNLVYPYIKFGEINVLNKSSLQKEIAEVSLILEVHSKNNPTNFLDDELIALIAGIEVCLPSITIYGYDILQLKIDETVLKQSKDDGFVGIIKIFVAVKKL